MWLLPATLDPRGESGLTLAWLLCERLQVHMMAVQDERPAQYCVLCPLLLLGPVQALMISYTRVCFHCFRDWHNRPALCRAPPGVFLNPSAWAWLDPGAFALIGAGAFMGGVTRLTISLAVIMMEVCFSNSRAATLSSAEDLF